MLLPVKGTHILETAYCLPVFNILIKNSSDKGHGSRFASFLTRGMEAILLLISTGVRAYTITTSDESV